MSARGRRPKGEFKNKLATISTRVTSDTREALEGAAAKSGRSLSQEIEWRLRRSFDEERGIVDKLGGPESYAFLRLIAQSIDMTARQAGNIASRARGHSVTWLNDPYVYDQAVKAVIVVLEAFRPEGDPARPKLKVRAGGGQTQEETDRLTDQVLDVLGEGLGWGAGYAIDLLRHVARAPEVPGVPQTETEKSETQELAERVRPILGDLAKRLTRSEEDE